MNQPDRAEQKQERMDGAALIAAERRRQVKVLAYRETTDERWTEGELAIAAACYADPRDKVNRVVGGGPESRAGSIDVPRRWPWAPRFYRPTAGDRVRTLVKAGALIAAEIDRLRRVGEES